MIHAWKYPEAEDICGKDNSVAIFSCNDYCVEVSKSVVVHKEVYAFIFSSVYRYIDSVSSYNHEIYIIL